MALPDPIVPNAEVALIDERAEQLGCNIQELMERAGAALCAYVREHYSDAQVLIACGPGNNGGDGYVAARLLAERGHKVYVWPISKPKSPLCIQQSDALPEQVHIVNNINEVNNIDLIIDAILGAGIVGPLRQPIKLALDALRTLSRPCIAADMPTGCSSGEALSPCHTLTFQVAKQNLTPGTYSVIDIGIPQAAYSVTAQNTFRLFPLHRRQSHKGNNGSVFILSGWEFPGARHYCSMAALHSGCDLAHCWVRPQDELDHACIRQDAEIKNLNEIIERCDVVLLGPGMGRSHRQLIDTCFQIATDYQKPCVLDADAIHLLKYQLRGDRHPPVLLTPHRGELAALLGVREITEDDIHSFARPNKIILSKNVVDFISDGKQWQRNPYGNPRMAVGGTGDVLAGLCAGLVARGCRLFDAARIAAYWSCTTADALWEKMGPCYLPDDVLDGLSTNLKEHMDALGLWPPRA